MKDQLQNELNNGSEQNENHKFSGTARTVTDHVWNIM